MNEIIYSSLAAFCIFSHFLISLINDALRFASSGLIKAHLQKRYSNEARLEKHIQRMDGYFEDEGRNLRELEWASYFFILCGLVFSIQSYMLIVSDAEMHIKEFIQFASYYGLLIWVLSGFTIRIFSELFAESILIHLRPFWSLVHILFVPVTFILDGIQTLILRIIGQEKEEEEEEKEEKEQKLLDSMEDGKKAGVFEDSEQEMIENLIEFKDLDVSEVMTPRTDMVAVSLDADLDEVVTEMKEKKFSRILVYKENRDNVVGFVHVRDLLPYWNNKNGAPAIQDLMHEPYLVPETKKIRTLFQEFKSQHLHIAVVLDEYGGTEGVITLEDILEEIVGEIVDEHQEEEEQLYELKDEDLVTSAKLRVSELNEVLSTQIEEDDHYDSVGGLLIATLGRIPVKGEQGELEEIGLSYKILEANERRIEKVLFKKLEEKVEA